MSTADRKGPQLQQRDKCYKDKNKEASGYSLLTCNHLLGQGLGAECLSLERITNRDESLNCEAHGYVNRYVGYWDRKKVNNAFTISCTLEENI